MAQRILVIDDTQEILDLLRTILEKDGDYFCSNESRQRAAKLFRSTGHPATAQAI